MARRPSLDALLALLARGPRNESEAVEELGLDVDDRRDWPLAMELLGDPRVVPLGDGRIGSAAALADGLTTWQRVGEHEVAARTVEMREAALLLAATVVDPLHVRVGDEVVRARMSVDDTGAPDLDGPPVVDLPEGWEPDLGAVDLVGFAVVDGTLALVRGPVGPDDAPAADLVAGVTAAVDAIVGLVAEPLFVRDDNAADRGLDDAVDDDDAVGDAWVVHLEEVSSLLLADHGEVLCPLDRPFEEVVRAAGWPMDDATIVGPGVTEEELTLYTVGHDLVRDVFPGERPTAPGSQATGLAWAALTVVDDEGDLVDALAPALDVTPAAEVLVRVVGRLAPDDRAEVSRRVAAASAADDRAEVSRRVAAASAADDGRSPGLALLHAHVLLGEGDGRGALDRLTPVVAAAGADPDDGWSARHLHALLVAATGDIAAAATALRALDDDETADVVERWRPRPPTGVGRNDRCPCWSGRKFKQCCLVRPAPLDLTARVGLLWWKYAALGEVLGEAPVVPDLDGIDDDHALLFGLAADALVAEEDALPELTTALASLLPEDEAALAATWGPVRHRVYEVDGQGPDAFWLRDLVTGDELVVHPPAELHDDGATLLAIVVPGPDGPALVGTVVPLDRATRSLVVTAVASESDGGALVELVASLLAAVDATD